MFSTISPINVLVLGAVFGFGPEIALLRKLWGKVPVDEIARELNRTRVSIQSHASRLGLSKRGKMAPLPPGQHFDGKTSSTTPSLDSIRWTPLAVTRDLCQFGITSRSYRSTSSA